MMAWGCDGWFAIEIEGVVAEEEIAGEGRKEVRGGHGEVHGRRARNSLGALWRCLAKVKVMKGVKGVEGILAFYNFKLKT